MAIDLGPVTATIDRIDRGWRVDIMFREDGSSHLTMFREIHGTNTADGSVILDRDVPVVSRESAQVDGKTYQIRTAGKETGVVKATGAEILALLLQMSDDERQVDIDASSAAKQSAARTATPAHALRPSQAAAEAPRSPRSRR